MINILSEMNFSLVLLLCLLSYSKSFYFEALADSSYCSNNSATMNGILKQVTQDSTIYYDHDYESQAYYISAQMRSKYNGTWSSVVIPSIKISNSSRVALDVYGQRISISNSPQHYCLNAYELTPYLKGIVNVVNFFNDTSLTYRNFTNLISASEGFADDEIKTIRSLCNATTVAAKDMTDYTVLLRTNLGKWKYPYERWSIVATRFDYNGSYLNSYITTSAEKFVSITGQIMFKQNKINVFIWQLG